MNSSCQMQLVPLPALQDNYIWVLHNNSSAIVVDPGVAEPVNQYLTRHKLSLCMIWVTHHHGDHTAGIPELLIKYPMAEVVAPESHRYERPHVVAKHFDMIDQKLFDWAFTSMHTPGHTLDHVSYWCEDLSGQQSPILFCGDTLFSGGCGRVFEGTFEQMWTSLKVLRALPENTRVCAAHEYTESNLSFACQYTGNRTEFVSRMMQVRAMRASHRPSMPSSLAEEKTSNIFLRADDDRLKCGWITMGLAPSASVPETFGWLRHAKNHFTPV